jgi:hypothetical protein
MTDNNRPAQLSERPRVVGRQMFAWLGAPTAWFVSLMVVYGAQDILCQLGADPVLIRATLVALSIVAALVAAAAGWTAWRIHHGDRAEPATARSDSRRELLAVLGLFLAFVFLVAIVLTALSALLVSTC